MAPRYSETAPLMPDHPIVDTHLHLWDPGRIAYPWLAGVPALNRPFLVPDLAQAVGAVAVERFVFVQCEAAFDAYEAEAAFVAEIARAEPRIAGLVAWAPLEGAGPSPPTSSASPATPSCAASAASSSSSRTSISA